MSHLIYFQPDGRRAITAAWMDTDCGLRLPFNAHDAR